ncbi:MAG TPA: bifunctional serine/threonine-protein kinase/formylglycine-generating enzyme family protein [Aggregatilineales bacterium]|nr:bifunctional serine/threonine-protein kinase/formylglycine-generating enzyme family protein [Aggregatilineales bacterium]
MDLENLTGQQFGNYLLQERLGAGGMATVYRGRQVNLRRDVAVKVLSRLLASDPGYVERFDREAHTAALLEHPHIVTVYDFGTAGEISYVVMRLLSGGTLADRLSARAASPQPLPSLGEIAELLRQLGSALDYAHANGIIHRDMKPGNIMFDEQGQAYIVDFGIAKLLNDSAKLTKAGMAMGTPSYMSPEQCRGKPASPASDQYAVSVLVFLLVTGHLPFEGSSAISVMNRQISEPPPNPKNYNASLPDTLVRVLMQGLAKLPDQRFASVSAFADAFRTAVAGREGESTGYFTFRFEGQLESSKTPTPLPTSKQTPATPSSGAPARIEPAVTPKDAEGETLVLSSRAVRQTPPPAPVLPPSSPPPARSTPVPPAPLSHAQSTAPQIVIPAAAEAGETQRRLPLPAIVGGGLAVLLVIVILGLLIMKPGGGVQNTATPTGTSTITPTTPLLVLLPSNTPNLGQSGVSTAEVGASTTVPATTESAVEAATTLPEAAASATESTVSTVEAETPTSPPAVETTSATTVPTQSSNLVQTLSFTATATLTDTSTATATDTDTPVPTDTPTPTATDTFTPTPSDTPTSTFTATPKPTDTPPPTATDTATVTPTPTFTPTLTSSPTFTATATPTPVVVITRRDSANVPQVKVMAGCFQMGGGDSSADPSERPAHRVCLTHDYWIDQHETTNAEFQIFVDKGGYKTQHFWSAAGWKWLQRNRITGPRSVPGFSMPDQPRTVISWYEAEAYANWRGARLPTEAEWEYAARGPAASVYPLGDAPARGDANIAGLTQSTFPSGRYPKDTSWISVFDMTGNVWEWTADWYMGNYYDLQVQDDPAGPTEPGPLAARVTKGGSWNRPPGAARGSTRIGVDPGSQLDGSGFRLVSEVTG